jgi:hypothetical protein
MATLPILDGTGTGFVQQKQQKQTQCRPGSIARWHNASTDLTKQKKKMKQGTSWHLIPKDAEPLLGTSAG